MISLETDQFKLIGLFKVLSLLSITSLFDQYLIQKVDLIFHEYTDIKLLDAQYLALNSVYQYQNVSALSKYLPRILSNIHKQEKFFSFQCSSIQIINRFLKCWPQSHQEIFSSSLNMDFVDLLLAFPENSFFGVAFADLLKDNLENFDFLNYIFDSVTPILTQSLIKQNSVMSRMIAWQFFFELQDLSEFDQKFKLIFEKFDVKVIRLTNAVGRVLENSYGGEPPTNTSIFEVGDISLSFSPISANIVQMAQTTLNLHQ